MEIFESYFNLQTEHHTYQYSARTKLSSKPTIVVIHGIGDSDLTHLPLVSANNLENFNFILPDLLGHGRSSTAQDYSFANQVKKLRAI